MKKKYFFPNLRALFFKNRSINILHSALIRDIIHLSAG